MSNLKVTLVPHWEVNRVWNEVRPLLKPATDMSEGRYDISDLQYKLLTGEFQLWVIFDEDLKIVAAITSTFTRYPQSKALSGQFLGGAQLEKWRDKFCDIFDRWAVDNDCDFIELTGRAGWSKVLAPNGYLEVYRTYQRALPKEQKSKVLPPARLVP